MRLELELLDQTDTTIFFTWTDTGETCRVERDGATIYKGTENSFRDEGLTPGELYIYTIERLNSQNKPVERIKLQTGTENYDDDFINRLQQITVSTIVSDSKIAIAWGEIEGIPSFDIYRDGEFLATVEKNQYTDLSAEKDIPYSYWIHGKRPLERSEESMKRGKSVLASLFGMVNVRSNPEEAAMEEFWIKKRVGSRAQLLAEQPTKKDQIEHPVWQLRYMTFLSQDILPNPNLFSPYRFFKGDGRSYDPNAKEYRTRVDLNIRFSEEGSIVEFDKDVGTTIAYNWRKKFSKADAASSAGIELKEMNEDSHKVAIDLKHSVGNPLVTSPDIDYQVAANFYRVGVYDIIGIHDQAPNHEVYLKSGKQTEWEQIHEAEDKGLSWMAEPIAGQYWRISNFE
ncbi:DUF3238 domain-containing protein [Planococcus sp. CAU13]|uniref:DUF3238 domain-containing protein n=1 Tax=Planococcus sp. CAU13 TaxID=1541197 RepID=UPI00053004C5|nr:DUF3238 domain-containing protein [Planococcus sp. CAU13]